MKKLNVLIAAILIMAGFGLNAQVAITTNGSSADGSAMLDVQSTSKGFLPPRMTQVQRDAITPVAGLIIYNSSTNKPNYYNGTEWMNCDGSTAKTLAIGDAYQGGKVAYILHPGDLGYNANVQHGIIAALADQSTGIAWITGGSTQTTFNGNTLTDLGTGQANTNFMKAQTGYTGGAAKVCDDYVNTETGTGVYSDWYLPSIDELNKLYFKKDAIGGFASAYYWSSSEVNATPNQAWLVSFDDGNQYPSFKTGTIYVRAVRSF